MTDPKRDVFLVLRAQTGDKIAFEELLQSVEAPLFRYIYRLTERHDLAEDTLQEVFILIYRKLRWLENPKLFRPWAYRIASREIFRRLKKEKRWREQIRDEEVLHGVPATRSEPKFDPELIEKIPALLAQISPASRAVLMLHYLAEMSLAETAETLGINQGTVKSRLAYGLESLRRIIKKEKGFL